MAKLTALPAVIQILGKPYEVSIVASLDDGASDGEMSEHFQRILIAAGQTWENEKDTVLHEVVHSIEERLQLKLREKQVALLATGLLQVLRENPAFVRYLCAKRPTVKKPAAGALLAVEVAL